MSRSIDISYEDAAGKDTDIEIHPPYYLLGTQQTSLKFSSIARLKEIGIERKLLVLAPPFRSWFSAAVPMGRGREYGQTDTASSG